MANGSWRNATISSPCPICGKPDWCSVSVDGNLAACRRLKEGGQVKADANGSPYYLHWLSGTRSPASPPPPPQSECLSERADIDTLHAVYSALLARLQLSAAHNNNLHIRGLRDPEIDQLGYRTLTGPGRSRLAQELLDKFGDVVFQVPGFTIRERNGTRYVTLAGARGLLIPVRDIRGRIAALKIRRDESDGQRYSFLSSKRYGGPGPGAPVHVPLGVPSPASIVRLTEGDLKADIAFRRTGVPTISIPGVSSWRAGIEALKGLNAKVVRLAFDKDARNKAPVARMLAATAERLAAEGFTVEFERWPEEYKGIDDALAADAFVEILSGDSAQRAIAEIVAEGTSGESPQVEAKHRLADVLTKGQETLFRDREVLAYLAALAEEDPAEFACRRAQARTAGIRLRDLDTVIAPLRREIRSQKPPAVCGGAYRISAGRIVYLKPTMQGVVEVPLSNFWACISDTVILDDGVSKSAAFGIEGGLVDGRPLPRVTVNASEFPRMDWLTSAWQGRAVVFAGQGARDHLRCAIELLSTERIERTEFLHTGWREIGGAWAYLHAGGAIGSDGPIETVTVTLPSSLAGFQLPAPPIERKLTEAVRASLRLLDLAPPRIMFPLLASAYRAVLGACDFSIHVSGPSGVFKTETTALIQQHFGRGLDARHLPGSWSSTANALEVQAFLAKDAVFSVDDFAPTGSAADVQRYHREADRLLRAQGNSAGRHRLGSDASLRQTRPPRGLIVSTGEDVPRGHSLRARILVIEFSNGDLKPALLTTFQRDATAGLYAEALAGFLQHLAPSYEQVLGGLRSELTELRQQAMARVAHRRTPEIMANLYLGLKYFLDFALTVHAISGQEKSEFLNRAWLALEEATASQIDHVQVADPVSHFLRLLSAVLASGRAHCAAPTGREPANPSAWGWRQNSSSVGDSWNGWRAQGQRIGWTEGDDLFLEPEVAYAAVQELANSQGDSLPIAPVTLRKRLKDKGLLVSAEAGKLTTRRTLDGQRRMVIHLKTDVVCGEKSGESGE